MAILNGFIRTKRYRKLSDGSYKLQSEATHESSVFFDDGTTLTEKIESHPQSASDITAGTLGGQIVAPADTDYTANRLRNTVFTTEDPTDGVSTSYVNGTIICVYSDS